MKWYEKGDASTPKVIISSRIRLARNLTDFTFPNRLSDEDAKDIITTIADIFSGRIVRAYSWKWMFTSVKSNGTVTFH